VTDVLLARFAALADPTDDSDWLDVRRRARHMHTRVAVAVASAAAVLVAAAALAAGGGWLFSTHDRQVTAATSVSLNGKSWLVSITSGTFGRVCFRIGEPTGKTTCVGRLGELRRARPFGATGSSVPGGQIWVGATIGFARRVVITDSAGRAYTAKAIAAPKGTKTPFRYWALAVAGTAKSITAYDADGHSIRRSLSALK
jgi:hypothetical protein